MSRVEMRRSPPLRFVVVVVVLVVMAVVDVPRRALAAPVAAGAADVSVNTSSSSSANSTTTENVKVKQPSEVSKRSLPSVKSPSSSTPDDAPPRTIRTQSHLPVAEAGLVIKSPSSSSSAGVASEPSETAMTSDEFAMPSDTLTNDDVNDPMVYDDVSQSLANQNKVRTYDDDAGYEALLEQLLRPRETRRSSRSDEEIDMSPRKMAEYLLLTDDFRGVQHTIDDLVSSGLLTPDEADGYEEAVRAEYSIMSQESYLPSRDQRSFTLQDFSDVREPAMNQADYEEEEYLSPSSIGVAATEDDADADEQLQRQQAYLPTTIDRAAMAQIDDRILRELLQQQAAMASDSEGHDDDDVDERYLEETENITPVPGSSADSAPVLEAELESLLKSEKHSTEHDDTAEEELEQIGKLLRNTKGQDDSTAEKKP